MSYRTMRARRASPGRGVSVHAMALTSVLALGGCASTAIDRNFQSVQDLAETRLGVQVKWLTTDEERRQARADVDATLAQPLSADDAVRLALAHSPALQSALFESAAMSAEATQSARLPNPILTFERLVRRQGSETELDIGRMLGFSVFELFLLPSRLRMVDFQQQQLQWRLASDVVRAATDARHDWVRAVAAQQALKYFEQVKLTADAGAELARRMQAVGNFNKLQRAHEQAFAADAVAQLARARQTARSTRESLTRSLGLDDAQARLLKLPDRLPDLPKSPRAEEAVVQQALDERFDVRQARADLAFTAHQAGLTRITGLVNGIHIAAVRNSETGEVPQKGYELELPLPIFDFGDATQARSKAIYMAALNRTAQVGIEASSRVRENYSAYRTAYDLARHYLEEVVPLRKTIAEENQLRYNAMLIDVFELLADARGQVSSVVQALEAQRDFWLADAALQATLLGQPAAGVSIAARPAAAMGREARH